MMMKFSLQTVQSQYSSFKKMGNMKDERISMADNRVLTEVFGSKRVDVIGDTRKLRNYKPYDGILHQILL